MKKLIFILVALMFASCVTTKTSKVMITPVGNWDYSITGTPEGDFNGVMSIAPQDKAFTAKLNSSGSELTIDKFTWDEPTKKVGGELYYSGTQVFFDATLAGEEMIGTMSAGGRSFPFKATRKK